MMSRAESVPSLRGYPPALSAIRTSTAVSRPIYPHFGPERIDCFGCEFTGGNEHQLSIRDQSLVCPREMSRW